MTDKQQTDGEEFTGSAVVWPVIIFLAVLLGLAWGFYQAAG